MSQMDSIIAERAVVQAAHPEMLLISGGTFRMGSDKHYPEEAPAHRVTVDSFLLTGGEAEIDGLSCALALKGEAAKHILQMPEFREAQSMLQPSGTLIRPAPSMIAEQKSRQCGLIVFPSFQHDAGLKIQSVSPALAGLQLMQSNLNAHNLPGGRLSQISALARSCPALLVTFGSFDQLDGIVDMLSRAVLQTAKDEQAARRFLSIFPPAISSQMPCESVAPSEHSLHHAEGQTLDIVGAT